MAIVQMGSQANAATRRVVRHACLRKHAYPTMAAAEDKLPKGQAVYLCSWAGHWHRTSVRGEP